MYHGTRLLKTGRFGTFRYDPKDDRYDFDEGGRALLGELASPDARYGDMLARMPPAVRKEYEHWRVEAAGSTIAGRLRVPFRLTTREISTERRRLLMELKEHGEHESIGDLAACVGRDPTRVSRDLKQLIQVGLVETERHGKTKRVRATGRPVIIQ